MQHKGSFLGLAWTLLNPLFVFGIYAFVFVGVFNSRFGAIPGETRADYAIGLFLGLTLVQLVQESIILAPPLVVQNTNFVKKVVFPLEILPASTVGAAVFRCLVALLFVISAVLIWGPGLTLSAFWLVPILVCLVLLTLGVSWGLAAVGVFLRDVGPLMQFASLLLIFASAVFYSFKNIPGGFSFLKYNPLLIAVEESRSALLWHHAPSMSAIGILGGVSLCAFMLGYATFVGLKGAFSDVL